MAIDGINKCTRSRKSGGITRISTRSSLSVENEFEQTDAGRNGTAESRYRETKFSGSERGQGKKHFPCSVDHEQNWQPYSVDPYSAD